jgi:fructose-bisphosphate aldolase class II
MVAHADEQGWKGGNYKKINLPFENKLLGQPREVRERMCKRVEDFVYTLLTDVFNAEDTAPMGIEAILQTGSYDLGHKVDRIEDPLQWTEEKIIERGATIISDKGPAGDYDD